MGNVNWFSLVAMLIQVGLGAFSMSQGHAEAGMAMILAAIGQNATTPGLIPVKVAPADHEH